MAERLEALCCRNCQGAVPLGEGDRVRCPYCGEDVEIPESYRALRDAERAEAGARVEARALYRRLGRARLWYLLRLFAIFNLWGFLFVGVPLLTVVGIVAVERLYVALAPVLRAQLSDTFDQTGTWGLTGAFLLVVGGVTMALGVYGRRRVASRRGLQAALAARPPKRVGGTALCRSCGAPLEVSPEALGVRCLYCRTDNLVALPQAWVAPLAGARTLGAAIEEAGALEREERGRLGRQLGRQLIGVVVVAAVLFGVPTLIFGLQRGEDPTRSFGTEWPPAWRTFVDRRVLIRKVETARKGNEVGSERTEVVDSCAGPVGKVAAVRFVPDQCTGERGCYARWYVALRHGQRIGVASGELPTWGEASLVRRAPAGSWWKEEEFGVDEARAVRIDRHGRVELVAPLDAWYRLEVHVPGAEPGRNYPLCIEIPR